MKNRILEILIGEIKLPGPKNKQLRITRIADYSDVPNGVEEVDNYIKHYLRLGINSISTNTSNGNIKSQWDEMIFPLQRKVLSVRNGDIVGTKLEKVEFRSDEVKELIHCLEKSLRTDPEDKFLWGSLTMIPDWVWVNEEDGCWWHEEPPTEVLGRWKKYEEYLKKSPQ
jgi:hypothetical protein